MNRLFSALALILSLSAVIQAVENATATELLSANRGFYDRACNRVRCSQGFECVSVRDIQGYRQPKCVRTRAQCRDLTGHHSFRDRALPTGEEELLHAPGHVVTCRRDNDCNFQRNRVRQFRCCRLRGNHQKRCVSVPSYTPRGRY